MPAAGSFPWSPEWTGVSLGETVMDVRRVLTIAGSDSSGGAGIQADLKTICAHGMYGMSAITALTAQNTTGVAAVQESTPEFLAKQLDCVFDDIYPDAVKVGMVANAGLIEIIGEKLSEYVADNVVVDPVMVATSGARLLDEKAVSALIEVLFPLADIVTPNVLEAEVLCGFSITNRDEMVRAAKVISRYMHGAVLIKGGHLGDDADDLLYDEGEPTWLHAERIDTKNTHGTGCTLSSAIACNLAAGKPMKEAVARAKDYLWGALASDLDLGHGSGPVNHLWRVLPVSTVVVEEG